MKRPIVSAKTMFHRPSRRGQQGMALLISLIVLVVVSMLGVVSMRTALFQNRVSINNQVETLAFQMAESGLDDTMELAAAQAWGPDGLANTADDVSTTGTAHIFGDAINEEDSPRRVCMTAGGVPVVDSDHGIRTSPVDEEDVIEFDEPCDAVDGATARVTTLVSRTKPDPDAIQGYDLSSYTAEAVQIRAEGDIPGTSIRSIHIEKWFTMAPAEPGA